MRFSIYILSVTAACISGLAEAAALPVLAEAEAHGLEERGRHFYTHCACQASPNGGIDSSTTARVVSFNTNRWKLDIDETQRGTWGAHFTGVYAYAVKGFVDGDAFYNECLQNGAGDSTCFGRQ